MADLAPELLDANLRRGGYDHTFEAIDVRSLTRSGRSQLAEMLAGTDDRKSRDYKSARRRVERWQRKGTLVNVTPRSRRQLQGVQRQQTDRLRRFRAHGGDMRVLIENNMSETNIRQEWLPPGRWVHIRQQRMRAVIRYWAEGETELAAGLLYSEFLHQYGVPDSQIDDWQTDTDVIDLELEPSRPR